MAAQKAFPEDDLQKLWDETLTRLYNLSGVTTNRNAELERRVADLEVELAVWKRAHSTAMDTVLREKDAIQHQLSDLQSSIDDDSFVYCIIDGDRLVFSHELLRQGLAGGRQAAQLLTKMIAEHLTENPVEVKGRLSFWVNIYLNKQELEDVLTSQDICTSRELQEFFLGFSQSSPRFSVIDVGCEGASVLKVQEYLRTYIHLPQTLKVFFGGHDEGYGKTVASLRGAQHKLAIIDADIPRSLDIVPAQWSHVWVHGLFTARDIGYTHHQLDSAPDFNPRGVDNSPTLTNLSQNSSQTSYNTAPNGVKAIDPALPLNKQNPPPCNEYYLMDSCSNGMSCKYSHDYVLTAEQSATLSANAKKAPCNYLKTGVECPFGDQCCWGHTCPNGPKCFHLSKGKCWFKGDGMHGGAAF